MGLTGNICFCKHAVSHMKNWRFYKKLYQIVGSVPTSFNTNKYIHNVAEAVRYAIIILKYIRNTQILVAFGLDTFEF